jgi:choline dehydrogenase-like flavoprotein
MKTDYDLIIIGSGARGGTLARHLAPSSKSILILERGGWLKREPENWDAEEVFQNTRYISTDVWRDPKGKRFQPGAYHYVGCATKMYGAWAQLTLSSIYGWTTLLALRLATLAFFIVASPRPRPNKKINVHRVDSGK